MSLPVDKAKSDTARAEGNSAFKKGRWSESIGYYTNAILYNSGDPLAYGNRAQAYLKLEKYADAERDCTSALSIQGGNVKALYRRALARKGLEQYDGAIADLRELLKAEVGNVAALEELEELETLKSRLATAKAAKPKRPLTPPQHITSAITSTSKTPKPPSIEPISSDEDKEKPVTKAGPTSFSSLKSSRAGKKTAFVPPLVPKHTSAVEEKAITPTLPTSTLPKATSTGSTQHAAAASTSAPKSTPTTSSASDPQPSSAAPVPSSLPIPTPPTDPRSTATGTGILLLRALNSLSPASGWALLRQYPPANIAVMLGAILEPDTLGLILMALAVGSRDEALSSDAGNDDRNKVKAILQGLKTTPRFGMNMMMLDSEATEAGRTAWRDAGGQGAWP